MKLSFTTPCRFNRRTEKNMSTRSKATEVFGKEKNPCRLVYGVASLPLGAPVELEVIFEVG
jgi:enamine deaminase RidA (YjgF/YER057c/UK114 family)